MPRRQLALVRPAQVQRSLTASAAILSANKDNRIAYQQAQGNWQEQCYRHYRICGEARFAAQFFGHALSKSVLYVSDDDTDATPATAGTAFDLLQALFRGSEGQAAMMASVGVHFTIAGECYLIGRNEPDPDPEVAYVEAPVDPSAPEDYDIWEIRSVLEVKKVAGNKWQIQSGSGQQTIDLDESAVVIRMWTPDPSHAFNADSPFRSLIPILEEIEYLTAYVMAQCSSRLAAAGLLVFPEEIDFPPPPDVTGENRSTMAEASKSDQLMMTLAYAMSEAIKDPSSPAAKVPITMTAPGEYIDKIKWLNFWTELDSETKSLRGEAIQRFALGMDLPPERILGMSSNGGSGGGTSNGVSHWGAWQIDEDTIKMHVEPMLDVLTAALTSSYIRPVTGGFETVHYDTSSLRLRPDRSAESLQLYDRGLIKGEVAVVENGFKPEDMMDEGERALWLLVKIASGSATPDMVAAAAGRLGVQLPVGIGTPNEARPTPSPDSLPLPRSTPDPSTSALVAACEGLVFRALERAGNRLRQSGTKPPGVPSYETHTLMATDTARAAAVLQDAWPCAAQVLEGIADHEQVVPVLDAYVTSLLTSRQAHSREAMTVWLETL